MSEGTGSNLSQLKIHLNSAIRFRRTIVLEQFVLIAALPEDTALLRTHYFPRSKVNNPFVGSILK